jgi:hypothetical protein
MGIFLLNYYKAFNAADGRARGPLVLNAVPERRQAMGGRVLLVKSVSTSMCKARTVRADRMFARLQATALRRRLRDQDFA